MEKKPNFKARRWGRKATITSFSLILGRLWAFPGGGWPEGHVQEMKIQGNRHPLNLLCSISPRLLGLPCLVRRLRVRAPDAGGRGLISGQGTKDPTCLWSKNPHKQAKKKNPKNKTTSQLVTQASGLGPLMAKGAINEGKLAFVSRCSQRAWLSLPELVLEPQSEATAVQ